MARRNVAAAAALAALLGVSAAHAQPAGPAEPEASTDAPEEPPMDEATERGRRAYVRGVELSKNEQWGEALAAFEEAAAARDAPLVEYNIAYCQRALGRYVAARRTARQVLAAPEGLSQAHVADLEAYANSFDDLVVQVRVTMVPRGARMTIDGRPLVRDGDTWLAGVGTGRGATDPKSDSFTVLLDPGSHLFRAIRAGHQDAVVHKSYRAGQRTKLELRLDELPATIRVKSRPSAAIVRVDEREVGIAPIELERPEGSYRIEVVKDDYETYSSELDLSAGQRAEITAELVPYTPPLYERWWFWAALAGAVATGVVTAVVLTRPEPEPPPYELGSTGWIVDPQPASLHELRF